MGNYNLELQQAFRTIERVMRETEKQQWIPDDTTLKMSITAMKRYAAMIRAWKQAMKSPVRTRAVKGATLGNQIVRYRSHNAGDKTREQ